MGKAVKLIMITPENNNKFYHMTENTNGTFTAEWGRVGATGQSQDKSMSQWDKVYREKVGKGYKDNTELFIVEGATNEKKSTTKSVKDFLKSRTAAVIDIVKKLQGWAKGSIEENYTVTSENVTQKQIDKAQSILNDITQYDLKKSTITEFNNLLIEFYGVVPRKMKKVVEHLVKADDDLKERKNKIITEEQATLDVMAGQVLLNTNIKETTEEEAVVETDIIQASGLEIVEVTDSKIINQIKDLMGPNKNQFKAAFEFKNVKTHVKYDKHIGAAKNKKEELFWHGSRNENWWSIVTTGLLIRPSNAVATGSMFGDGIYFADKFQKSYGYSSGRNSYFAKGNSNLAILALYSVHVGAQKNIKHHNSDCYSLNWHKIQKDGFDSVFAHGGADLRNNEYIVYQSQQNTIKYLVAVEA